MIQVERQEVKIFKDICIRVSCDVCEKDINEGDAYFEVNIHDYDMGYDFINHEHHCSYECLKEHMDKYYKQLLKNGHYEVEQRYMEYSRYDEDELEEDELEEIENED